MFIKYVFYISANKESFYWFDHTFSHQKFHKLNETQMRDQFLLNHKFAKINQINIYNNYTVVPHHSGI